MPSGPGRSRRVIFVMGPPRSGTTLVDLVLGAHPQGRALGELAQFGRADRSVARRGGLCGICEGTCSFWQDAVPRGFRRRWFGGPLTARIARLARPGTGLYGELFAADPAARYLSDSSKSIPWLDARLASRRDWRDAEPLFVLVTRDGRAVLNSWMRKRPEVAVTDHIARWRRITQRLDAAYDGFAGRRMRLSYEALARHPADGAAELARFAGVAPDPAMARYWEAEQHPVGGNVGTRTLILRHRAGDGAIPFAPSSADKTAYYAAQGLAIRPDLRWHTELPHAARETFERMAGAANAAYRHDAPDVHDAPDRQDTTGSGMRA